VVGLAGRRARTVSPTPRELAFPGPLTLGARGPGVRRVQEWLTLAGRAVACDGALGLRTATALGAFLEAEGLPVGLPLTERAWEALTAPLRRATAPVLAPGASLRELVVAVARQHLAEHPREVGGPNGGPWVRFYTDGHEGVAWPWCGGFVRAVLRQACASLGVAVPGWISLAVATMARLGAHLGLEVALQDVKPGDVFYWLGAGRRGHTGVVVGLEGAETLLTIEGNTDGSGGRDGDGVYERRRPRAELRFLRVA